MAWASVRRAEALKPAGRVFDSHRVEFTSGEDGIPPTPRAQWTSEMELLAEYAGKFIEHVTGRSVSISFYDVSRRQFSACADARSLAFRQSAVASLLANQEALDALLIHEAAHVAGVRDHLSEHFYRKCCEIGACARSFNDTIERMRR